MTDRQFSCHDWISGQGPALSSQETNEIFSTRVWMFVLPGRFCDDCVQAKAQISNGRRTIPRTAAGNAEPHQPSSVADSVTAPESAVGRPSSWFGNTGKQRPSRHNFGHRFRRIGQTAADGNGFFRCGRRQTRYRVAHGRGRRIWRRQNGRWDDLQCDRYSRLLDNARSRSAQG